MNPVRRPTQPVAGLQCKPLIGPVDDPLEREADRVAEAVAAGRFASPLSASAPNRLQRRCADCEEAEREGGGLCTQCAGTIRRQAENEEQEEDELRLKPAGGTPAASAAAQAAGAVSSGGMPMPPALRAYFEPRFGRDLSDVRFHTDPGAAVAARAIRAHAYTLGRDIAFAPGQFAPDTAAGRRLIAHELAHVVQQDSAGPVVRRAHETGDVDDPDVFDLPRPDPRQESGPPIPEIVVVDEPSEPGCPRPPTHLGNITPVPPCNEDGEDIDGGIFLFCTDSDVFKTGADREQLRAFAARQRAGSTFRVRAYASTEGPGTPTEAEAYNRRLSCHRAKRVVRELINAGVPENSVDAVAMGPTDRFAPGAGGRPLNRAAVVDATPPPGAPSRPGSAGLRTDEVRDAARVALVGGDYRIGADAYLARWTCGRYTSLAEAVSRTTIQIEGVDFTGGVRELGTIGAVGSNVIKLSASIMDSTDPVACAMNRIADLTFHHFARPQLPSFADQHRAGMHLVHLAGLPACTINRDPMGLTQEIISRPEPVDPFLGFAPACADRPLPGPATPGAGPRTQDVPPAFSVGPISAPTSSGSVVPSPSHPMSPTVGAEPDAPFSLAAGVTATGDAGSIAQHEIGFLQTVMAERWENTHVDGRRERRRFPLPLRDGPPSGDPMSAPPWFARFARVQAAPGVNAIGMTDAPNFRAFRALPDPAQSRFFVSANIPAPGAPRPTRHDFPMPRFVPTHPGNAPDRGVRVLHFNTWVAARRRGAPATLQDTQFLGGLMMTYRMNVDWRPTGAGGFNGIGSWNLTTRTAAADQSQQMVLRGATPLDFVSVAGVPLFNEFLLIDPPRPIAQAGGLGLSQYAGAVRAIVDPHRLTPRLRGEFIVQLRIETETGRLILDPPTATGGAVRVLPGDGGPISTSEALNLARTVFPELRKLVAGRLTSAQPATGPMNVPIRIHAVTP